MPVDPIWWPQDAESIDAGLRVVARAHESCSVLYREYNARLWEELLPLLRLPAWTLLETPDLDARHLTFRMVDPDLMTLASFPDFPAMVSTARFPVVYQDWCQAQGFEGIPGVYRPPAPAYLRIHWSPKEDPEPWVGITLCAWQSSNREADLGMSVKYLRSLGLRVSSDDACTGRYLAKLQSQLEHYEQEEERLKGALRLGQRNLAIAQASLRHTLEKIGETSSQSAVGGSDGKDRD